MLSRVASALFWLARSVERSDHAARLLLVTHGYAQELRGVSPAAAGLCWGVTSRLLGAEPVEASDGRSVFRRLAYDGTFPGSVLGNLRAARENARGVRDALSSEMWETLNVVYLRVLEEAGSPPSEAAELSLLRRVQSSVHLLQGLRDHTISQTDAWHFLRLGQFLERAGCMTRTLAASLAHPALEAAPSASHAMDPLHLAMTLRAAAAFEAYSQAEAALSLERVVHFLLLEHTFPRSVEHSLIEADRCLRALSGAPESVFHTDAEQICGRLVADLRFAAVEEVLQAGVHEYLQRLLARIWRLGEAIEHEYFS